MPEANTKMHSYEQWDLMPKYWRWNIAVTLALQTNIGGAGGALCERENLLRHALAPPVKCTKCLQNLSGRRKCWRGTASLSYNEYQTQARRVLRQQGTIYAPASGFRRDLRASGPLQIEARCLFFDVIRKQETLRLHLRRIVFTQETTFWVG